MSRSFAAMHDDHLDPDKYFAHENAEADFLEATEEVRQSILTLIKDYETPYNFYRQCYSGTSCGPSIGFKEGEKWKYCDELNDIDVNIICGISVSSIVEGSEVVTQTHKFEKPFEPKEFWEAVEAVDKEASFYWDRDNSYWFTISGNDETLNPIYAHISDWDDKMTVDDWGSYKELDTPDMMEVLNNCFLQFFNENTSLCHNEECDDTCAITTEKNTYTYKFFVNECCMF